MLHTAIVVDDDKEITELFSELLAMNGFKILAKGYTGFDAIELYRKHRPELIFLDVDMPVLDGVEALKIIKQEFPKTRVIIATANSSDELKKTVSELNATAVIYKPFDMPKILSVIHKAESSDSIVIQH